MNRYVLVFLLGILSSCYYDNEEELYPPVTNVPCGGAAVSFSSDVNPVIQARCLQCHSQSANMGSVVLEGHANLKSYASSGKLEGVITHASGFSPMPKNGGKLSDCEIATIKSWITDGMPNN